MLKGAGSATFSRAGATATTVLSTGLISTAISANTARSYYDPTTLSYLGYIAEEARTNLVLRSENFSLAWAAVGTPTRSAAAKTCGALNMDLIGDDSAAALEGYTQTITYTADATKTVSIFIAQGTSASTIIRLRDTTAGADRLLAAITWSGGLPIITMTTGTSQGYTTFPGSIFRIQLLTTSVTAANTNSLQIYPASDAALAVTGTGDVYAGGVQSENGTFATSYIPTAAATSARAADSLIFPISGNALDTVGSCSAKLFTFWSSNPVSAFGVCIEDPSGRALYVGSGSAPTTISIFDGTNVTTAIGLTSMQTAQRQRFSRWEGAASGVGGDGTTTSGTFDGNIGAGGTTNIGIGANTAPGNELSGCVMDVRIWQRALTDSEFQAL